jgi:hypothetical protein
VAFVVHTASTFMNCADLARKTPKKTLSKEIQQSDKLTAVIIDEDLMN